MAINSAALYNANDPYEILISQMIAIERQPQEALKTERKTQERLQLVMKDVDSKISALHTLMKELRDTFSSPFRGRSANVPANDAFTASAGDKAAYGAHTLKVERLASADARISQQYTSAANDLRAYFDTNGAQTFSIDVLKPTESDPNNLASISVTVDPTGTTNQEILDEIRTAINAAMDAALEDDTLATGEAAVASLVNETSSTARLSLRSGKSGYDNRLRFTDSADGLLGMLGVTNEDQATGTGGGAVVAVGTSETTSALNSKFVLDGLTLYRSTNTVSDALDGMTLTLKKADTTAYEFSVGVDTTAIKGKVNDFISKYNDLMIYLQNKSAVDGATGTRGDFAGDATFTGLRYGMRDDLARSVASQGTGAPSALADLGITIEKDGTLKLSDETKLLEAVEKDAGAVESLFAHDADDPAQNGFATRLFDRLEQFVGTKGILDGRKDTLDTRIKRLNDRIKDWDDRLGQRESQLRMQFAKMQETISILQGQGQYLSSFYMF